MKTENEKLNSRQEKTIGEITTKNQPLIKNSKPQFVLCHGTDDRVIMIAINYITSYEQTQSGVVVSMVDGEYLIRENMDEFEASMEDPIPNFETT